MDRRTLLAGTGAILLAAPPAAEGQQAKKVWRISFLSAGSLPANLAVKGPFRQGLHDLGYVEGRDFTTATTMYREMDRRFWLEQAEEEMGGPEMGGPA